CRFPARGAQGWLSELRNRQRLQGVSYWPIAAVVIPWLLGVAGFAWLRRRIPRWLSLVDERFADSERREQQASPSLLRSFVRLLQGVHRTLELLSLFALTVWL